MIKQAGCEPPGLAHAFQPFVAETKAVLRTVHLSHLSPLYLAPHGAEPAIRATAADTSDSASSRKTKHALTTRDQVPAASHRKSFVYFNDEMEPVL